LFFGIMVYLKKSFVDDVKLFKENFSFDLNELKYAYKELGFFLFIFFIVHHYSKSNNFYVTHYVKVKKELDKLSSELRNIGESIRSKKKKRSKRQRIAVQKNIVAQHELVVSKLGNKLPSDPKKSKKVLKRISLMNKAIVRRNQSIVNKRKCPSKLNRKQGRAEKFAFLSFHLRSGHMLLSRYFGEFSIVEVDKRGFYLTLKEFRINDSKIDSFIALCKKSDFIYSNNDVLSKYFK